MKTSIMVSVGAFGVLAAAVVLASPMSGDSDGSVAKAPNRGEAYIAATCGTLAPAQGQAGWHNALASKRALERDLVPAAGTSVPAKGCVSTDA